MRAFSKLLRIRLKRNPFLKASCLDAKFFTPETINMDFILCFRKIPLEIAYKNSFDPKERKWIFAQMNML